MKSALTACIVAGIGLMASAQSFYNLDFELASGIPTSPPPPGSYWSVSFTEAFPGWTGYCGTNQVFAVLYDYEWLDSAGISIFDSQETNEPVTEVMHGRYCACLYSGVLYGTYSDHVETYIAQTGLIPPNAESILFNFWGSSSSGYADISVTFNDVPIPLSGVSGGVSGDVNQFAGQVGELRFTAPNVSTPSYPFARSLFLIDDIRFSFVPDSAPVILTSPTNQVASVGDSVAFAVSAAGPPPLAYQWLFEGQPLAGANGAQLQLTNLQFSQSGAYSAVVTNAFGTATSAVAYLTIVWPAPYRILHTFTGSEGWGPWGGLVPSGTTLYGTTRYSGNDGTVFKINMDGSGYATLHDFGLSDGSDPMGGLVLSGGTLYGTTGSGGISPDPGVIFKINTNGGSFSLLKAFDIADGRWPEGDLILSGTTLYGTTSAGGSTGCGTAFKVNADGSGYTVLHNFTGYPNDGYGPSGGLVLSGTTLYGATTRGGSYGSPTGWSDAGYGTLFKVNSDGSGYTLLKQFARDDGWGPYGKLVSSGTTLYGITEGGVSSDGTTYGGGTIFQINTDGSGYTVLHSFLGPPSDGAVPYGGLILSGTTLYGVTTGGGSHGYSPATHDYGDGTVFKVNTDGTGYSVLKEFAGDDGCWPYAGLLLDGTTLYGTTSSGGASYNGVIFSIVLSPVIQDPPQTQTAESGSKVGLWVGVGSPLPLCYLWYLDATNLILCSTNSELELTNVQFSQAGTYTAVITNAAGAVTSSPAMLQVIAPVERRPVPGVEVMGQAGNVLNLDYADFLGPSPSWTTLGSVSLINTSQYWFDLTLPLPPQRFYRTWETGAAGMVPPLDLHMIPAITVTGNIGDSVRVDCINRFGPIDAWVTLATVVLTNTPQLYFDTSAPGQPERLYRLVPLP